MALSKMFCYQIICCYLLSRRHYVDVAYLQLLERLMTVLYPLSCEERNLMPMKIAEVYEMIVSHSAFLPSVLGTTSTDVKGE